MPMADIVENAQIAKKPMGGNVMIDNNFNHCGCGCQDKPEYPNGYWCPPPQVPVQDGCCQPYPYPYPCPPMQPSCGSTEALIAKLSKKSAVIRRMIENLVKKNKSIVISIGPAASYNFGTYMNGEDETEYGKEVLEILTTELNLIKEKICELTADLEADTDVAGEIEGTVAHL